MIAMLLETTATPLRAQLGVVVIAVLYGLVFRLQAATTDDLERLLAQAVIDALQAARLTRKEAAALMGIPGATFDQQLACVPHRHLTLNRLIQLPWSFWMAFTPALTWLIAKQRATEIGKDFGLIKAS